MQQRSLLYHLLLILVGLSLYTCADNPPPAAGTPQPTAKEILADTGKPYLPGQVSTTDQEEGGLFLTQQGEGYFWRRKPGEKQRIYRFYPDRPDVAPEPINISTDRDENAYVTRDGLTMYFGSERPIPGRPNLGNFDMNIWVATRPSPDADWS